VLLKTVVALILTTGLTTYTWITPWTYSENKGIRILLVMTLIMYALVFKLLKSHGLVVGVLFPPVSFSMHMVVDTQKIINTKIQGDIQKDKLSYDDYIIGVLLLYSDIIYLFVKLLKLLKNFVVKHPEILVEGLLEAVLESSS
jgi:FtsH-binding integral membrane protein